MTRLLEFIVAIIMVIILALIVGACLPSSGHIERSVTVSKDIRHVYDLFNNYRRLPDYSVLWAYDPQLEYEQSDKWYGPGTSISWTSDNEDVGDGKLTIKSAKPGFDKVETTGQATIVWGLQNQWHGTNKSFTIHLQRTGRSQKLVNITWSYDVDYGWNLINRYAGLYIHGSPDNMIQYSLKKVQNVLAAIPNISYDGLDPQIVKRPQQPVLLVSTSAKRNLTEVDDATAAAVDKIHAVMKKLGLHQTGPRIRFTTNYGDQTYSFDVAIPVDSDTVTIDGKQYTMGVAHAPKSGLAMAASTGSSAKAASVAGSASAAGAASVAAAGSSAPANASSAGKTKPAGPQPGEMDDRGRLVLPNGVRGVLAFGGKALEAVWYGSPAGIPPTRLRLKAYAETHGYPFNTLKHRPYDRQVKAYDSKGSDGKKVLYDQQTFRVYLPLKDGPEHTPEQAAGMHPKNPFAKPANAASAPANGSSAPAPASSAPAEAATAG